MKKVFSSLMLLLTVLFLFGCSRNETTADSASLDMPKANSQYKEGEFTEEIFAYLTDNETVLHLSSIKPSVDNYVSYKKQRYYKVSKVIIDNEIKLENFDQFFANLKNMNAIENLNYLNLSEANSVVSMFSGCENLITIDLSSFNTSNIESMSYMFNNCKKLEEINLSSFNTLNVKDMRCMFRFCYSIKTIDLSSFDFSNIGTVMEKWPDGKDIQHIQATIAGMFYQCKNLETIYSSHDIIIDDYFERTQVFDGCEKLVGGNGTVFDKSLNDTSMAVIDSDYQIGYFTYDDSKYYWKDGCFYINGKVQTNRWIYDKFYRYYVGEDGKCLTNQWYDGRYLGPDGKMYTNRYTPDGKYVNDKGKPVDVIVDYNSIDKNSVSENTWYRTDNGIWYYFENDRDTTKKGWFVDERDGQTYYLDPETGIMATGWKNIDGNKYYFNERGSVVPNWYYSDSTDTWESYGKKIKSLGSMFNGEVTPDGHTVDETGKMIE